MRKYPVNKHCAIEAMAGNASLNSFDTATTAADTNTANLSSKNTNAANASACASASNAANAANTLLLMAMVPPAQWSRLLSMAVLMMAA